MKNISKLFFLFFVVFLSNHAFGQEGGEIFSSASVWTNQNGSSLYIQSIDPSGMFSGYYINREPGYSCLNTPYTVTGWIYGTAITFTVSWNNSTQSCNSITSWTGFYYNGAITTLWQLVISGSTSDSQIIQGKDTFVQTAQKQSKSLILKK